MINLDELELDPRDLLLARIAINICSSIVRDTGEATYSHSPGGAGSLMGTADTLDERMFDLARMACVKLILEEEKRK